MEEIYKEWIIKYNERNMTEKFEATKDNITIHASSLSEMKKKIDSRKKQEFKRIPCYIKKYDKVLHAEITSIAEEASTGEVYQIWVSITGEDGRKYREKNSMSYAKYHDNEKNKEHIKKIRELEVEIKKLESQVEEHITQLDKITHDDIKNSIK